jgi:hypothetical protein
VTNVSERKELADITIADFRDVRGPDLTLYGCYIGMRSTNVEEKVVHYGLNAKKLSPDSISFFPTRGVKWQTSGVDAFLNRQRISWIRLTPTTSMAELGTPQVCYIERMKGELRVFFENYNDSRRVELFGEGKRVSNYQATHFRSYIIDYRERGVAFMIWALATNRFKLELAQLYIYDPLGKVPDELMASG